MKHISAAYKLTFFSNDIVNEASALCGEKVYSDEYISGFETDDSNGKARRFCYYFPDIILAFGSGFMNTRMESNEYIDDETCKTKYDTSIICEKCLKELIINELEDDFYNNKE